MTEVNSDVVNRSIVESIYETHRDQLGALIPILQKAQDVCGFLLPEVVQWTADRLDMALGKVYGVATFYSQFYLEDRGTYRLKLRDGTACHMKGAQALASAIGVHFARRHSACSPLVTRSATAKIVGVQQIAHSNLPW